MFFPVIFVIPVAIIFLLTIFKIKSNAFQKVANEYENMLQQEISDRNFDRIKEIFIEMLQKLKTNKKVSVIFENFHEALSYFDIPKELKAEFTEELATIKKIDAIRKKSIIEKIVEH